jgi:hypothetical protein
MGCDGRTSQVIFYVGSRGHQSDIGGITPASMPPSSTRVEEEGVLIDNFKLVDKGVLREVRACERARVCVCLDPETCTIRSQSLRGGRYF